MQITTVIAVALAPLLVPFYRWAFTRPGKWAHDWLWRTMPDGRLRTFLLKPRGKPRL